MLSPFYDDLFYDSNNLYRSGVRISLEEKYVNKSYEVFLL